MEKILNHNELVSFSSAYGEGDLVKYEYVKNNNKAFAYSKILKIKPKFDDVLPVVKLYYVMESSHLVHHDNIISIEKKVAPFSQLKTTFKGIHDGT